MADWLVVEKVDCWVDKRVFLMAVLSAVLLVALMVVHSEM
jgi:uncharacterized membrane protein